MSQYLSIPKIRHIIERVAEKHSVSYDVVYDIISREYNLETLLPRKLPLGDKIGEEKEVKNNNRKKEVHFGDTKEKKAREKSPPILSVSKEKIEDVFKKAIHDLEHPEETKKVEPQKFIDADCDKGAKIFNTTSGTIREVKLKLISDDETLLLECCSKGKFSISLEYSYSISKELIKNKTILSKGKSITIPIGENYGGYIMNIYIVELIELE